MLTLAPDEGIFVLSENPYADCFFCGFGGPESAIELELNPGYDDFLMDELVTVGILRLKRDDVSSGVYIMDNATAIKNKLFYMLRLNSRLFKNFIIYYISNHPIISE